MRRLVESEDLKQHLKPKKGLDYNEFLNKKFRPERPADCSAAILKNEVVSKLKRATEDESDPVHFVRLFAMWLCTVFLFPNAGMTSFPKKLLPHILLMDKVSWPDHVVEYLISNLEKKKAEQLTIARCTTLLVCWFCEHTDKYIGKRENFENATPRFLRWNQHTLCKKLVTDFGNKIKKKEIDMTWFDRQIHQDFVDPVFAKENYLIDLSTPARELEEERHKIKELEEDNLLLECDKHEIHYMGKAQIKLFVHITIFLREMYERNKDKLQLQAGEPERLAEIDKNIKECQEEESIFHESMKTNKPEYTGKEFEDLDNVFRQTQEGESSGKVNQHEMNSAENDQPTDGNETRVNMEVEDSVAVNNEDTQEMNESLGTQDGTPSTLGTQDTLGTQEKSWRKGFETGMKLPEEPKSGKSLENWRDGFHAGRKIREVDDLELNTVVENIADLDSVVENIAISAGIVEEKDDI